MSETLEALEDLLDLLKSQMNAVGAHAPNTNQALQRVEEILARSPCSEECQSATEVAGAVLNQLVLPALKMDPDKFQHVQRMEENLLLGHLPEEKDFCEVGGWMASLSEDEPDPESLPKSLFGRLMTLLSFLGESEPMVQSSLEKWRIESNSIPWQEAQSLLQQICSIGKKSAPPMWSRQRRVYYKTLLDIAVTYGGAIAGWGRQDKELSQLLLDIQKKGGRVEQRQLHDLLSKQSATLQKHARSLRAEMAESKHQAERLKEKLDQLESELNKVRSEQFMDPNTGLPDRFAFTAHLKRCLERADLFGEFFAVVLFHFYDFLPLLDRLGREGENRLLAALTSEMRRHLPDESFLARLSEERLVVLFPFSVATLAEKIGTDIHNDLLQTQFRLDEEMIDLDVHFGSVTFESGMDVLETLEKSDRLAALARSEFLETPKTEERPLQVFC